MPKSVNPSKIDAERIRRQASRTDKLIMVNGKFVKRNSNDNKVLKARKALTKIGSMRNQSKNVSTNEINADCLVAMGITVKLNRFPNKSLLREQESSDKLRNPNIVDVKAVRRLEKQKVDATDKFIDKDDPWHKADEDRPNYKKRKQKAVQKSVEPDFSSMVAAMYSINTSKLGQKRGSKIKK